MMMKGRWTWILGVAIALMIAIASGTMAQSPPPPVGVPVAPLPVDPSLPSNRPPLPTQSPSPTASPTPAIPGLPIVPGAPTPGSPSGPPLQAAPRENPLPLKGEYTDPNGRFKVALLEGYKTTPLAGSILVESQDGNLAYTVLALPQSQLGVATGILTSDALVQVAGAAFKQGEGFETGEVRSIPGGVQIDWIGKLTIAGKTQDVGGVILARQAKDSVLLLLIAATEAGGNQVLAAASALVDTLQPL